MPPNSVDLRPNFVSESPPILEWNGKQSARALYVGHFSGNANGTVSKSLGVEEVAVAREFV
jgi:hypothetical protein